MDKRVEVHGCVYGPYGCPICHPERYRREKLARTRSLPPSRRKKELMGDGSRLLTLEEISAIQRQATDNSRAEANRLCALVEAQRKLLQRALQRGYDWGADPLLPDDIQRALEDVDGARIAAAVARDRSDAVRYRAVREDLERLMTRLQEDSEG